VQPLEILLRRSRIAGARRTQTAGKD
jgi:hypothetical protein